jgi:hypothetical protein
VSSEKLVLRESKQYADQAESFSPGPPSAPLAPVRPHIMTGSTGNTPDHIRGLKNRDFFCYYAWPTRLNRIEKIAQMVIYGEGYENGMDGCENERFGGFSSEIVQTIKPL